MKVLLSALLILAPSILISAQIKKPQPPAVPRSLSASRQLLVVTSEDWHATTATARLFERKTSRSLWIAVGKAFPVVLGRSGLAWSEYDQIREHDESVPFKTEGDGASPAGAFPLTFVFSPEAKFTNNKVEFRKIEEFTECVDDPHSTHYNRIVNRMQVGNFDWKSSEKMIRIRPEYDLGVFVAYNSYPPRGGHGSCIFLHIWKNEATPTAGCTAMEKPNLERIVGWLDTKKSPYLIQLTEAKYNEIRRSWKFPKLK
jgi:L,D-peptidoglycan transpeptidase YkuD (ErfK/YbiS/YcfS/YnhG family)